MVSATELVGIAVISVLLGASAGYLVVSSSMTQVQANYSQLQSSATNLQSTAAALQREAESVNNRLIALNSSLTIAYNNLNLISAQIGTQNQRLTSLETLDAVKQMIALQQRLDSFRAYRDMKLYMTSSGSGLATALASEVVSQMDQSGLIPSIFGQGKDQVKAALIGVITPLLKGYLPSSSWVEDSAVASSTYVFKTSLQASISVSVKVFSISVTPIRIVVVATASVDISTDAVTNLVISSVSVVTL